MQHRGVPPTLLVLQHHISGSFKRFHFMTSLLRMCHQHSAAPRAHYLLTILYKSFLDQSLAGDEDRTSTSAFDAVWICKRSTFSVVILQCTAMAYHLFMRSLDPYLQLLDRVRLLYFSFDIAHNLTLHS